MGDLHHLHVVSNDPWTNPRSYRPDPAELLRQSGYTPSFRERTSLGERLVTFFRECSVAIGWSLYALAVIVGCYFAFRLGAGL